MSQSDSHEPEFITPEGGLRVVLQPPEVTWFDFLYFSRLANSLEGGWKGKSNWRSKGLEKLSEFVTEWTRNSLETRVFPEPRTEAFKFDRSLKERDHLKKFFATNDDLSLASEHELNYALMKGGLGINPLDNLTLYGYEIPLSQESEGQLKVDLFGVADGRAAIEIIELKKGQNTADSPLMALTEAICYALQMLRCRDKLAAEAPTVENVRAFDRETFKKFNLTLLAPVNYWSTWRKADQKEVPLDDLPAMLQAELEPIVRHVNTAFQEPGFCRTTFGNPEFHPELKLSLRALKLAK